MMAFTAAISALQSGDLNGGGSDLPGENEGRRIALARDGFALGAHAFDPAARAPEQVEGIAGGGAHRILVELRVVADRPAKGRRIEAEGGQVDPLFLDARVGVKGRQKSRLLGPQF